MTIDNHTSTPVPAALPKSWLRRIGWKVPLIIILLIIIGLQRWQVIAVTEQANTFVDISKSTIKSFDDLKVEHNNLMREYKDTVALLKASHAQTNRVMRDILEDMLKSKRSVRGDLDTRVTCNYPR